MTLAAPPHAPEFPQHLVLDGVSWRLVVCALLVMSIANAKAQPVEAPARLQVYQDLEEATARIGRLSDRPYEKLWDSRGYYQPETLIFHDLETGKEVWSLSMELCTDLANIERRCAWSCDGRYISFIGNKVFWNHDAKKLWQRTWGGYNYIASADGSERRKLWGKHDGRLILHGDKFNNWDQKRGNVLYYAGATGTRSAATCFTTPAATMARSGA